MFERSQATTHPANRPTRRQSTPGEFFGLIVKPQTIPGGHLRTRALGASEEPPSRSAANAPRELLLHLLLARLHTRLAAGREQLFGKVNAVLRLEHVEPPRAPRSGELHTE